MHQADKKIGQSIGQAGDKFDKLKADSVSEFEKTKKEANKEIDQFDKTVMRKTSEAKSGISSWFGFGK